MRYFCAMHDMIGNCKPKDFDRMNEAGFTCPCCKRPTSGDNRHGMELPEPFYHDGVIYTMGKQEVCNCFITGEKGKNYTEEEIEKHTHYGHRTIESVEEAEAEWKEMELEEEVKAMFEVVLP